MPEEQDFTIDEVEDEIATSGNPVTVEDNERAKELSKMLKEDLINLVIQLEGEKEQLQPQSKVSPEVIAEARKLASSGGLDIASFCAKYGITIDIETLLHGKLDKDGFLL